MYFSMIKWKSCQGQLQTSLTAGHFGNPTRVTLSVCGGSIAVYSRGVIPSDSPSHLAT
jgi:hypothetical protein